MRRVYSLSKLSNEYSPETKIHKPSFNSSKDFVFVFGAIIFADTEPFLSVILSDIISVLPSVSYTHLDVYKRQIHYHTVHLIKQYLQNL